MSADPPSRRTSAPMPEPEQQSTPGLGADARRVEAGTGSGLGQGRLRLGLALLFVLIVPAVGLLLFLPLGKPTTGGAASSGRAPNFEFTTFEGQELALSQLEGKGVVLNFWASWCVPCREEMPYFESTYQAYKDRGVVFVGLAMQDRPEDSRAFLEELGITYPNGPDEGGKISVSYGVAGLPTTVFITPDGEVDRTWQGALSEEQLVTLVEEIAP
ncbi:MAG: TlpA family protein disulfide reductase [Chloroflexota bacterium]|nr:TlpA family protein disulfide reductase [Chloroflexota bacterium]